MEYVEGYGGSWANGMDCWAAKAHLYELIRRSGPRPAAMSLIVGQLFDLIADLKRPPEFEVLASCRKRVNEIESDVAQIRFALAAADRILRELNAELNGVSCPQSGGGSPWRGAFFTQLNSIYERVAGLVLPGGQLDQVFAALMGYYDELREMRQPGKPCFMPHGPGIA